MENKINLIDLHCHPAMKPLGKSFKRRLKGKNNSNPRRKNSIWKYNPPSVADKLLNYLAGLTKFSQANFTAVVKGGVDVICVSLYPIEKEFFSNNLPDGSIETIAANFATGIGRKRVKRIINISDYYEDLMLERDFYEQLDGKEVSIANGTFKYKLVNSFAEIEEARATEEDAHKTICVIFTIEGLHVLNSDLNAPVDEVQILANVDKLKNWNHPPFFVGVAHHFWNHLCGHAKSISAPMDQQINQIDGMDEGFTELGEKVLHKLLDQNSGKQILLDIKHMSVKSRARYYEIKENNPAYRELPIIVSHGAANGYQSFDDKTLGGSDVVSKLNHADINVFNSEIILISKTGGIIGIQLDERRLGNEESIKEIKKTMRRSKILHYRSELVWNQVQHIAQVLDQAGLPAWDCMAIGTDFDGIIDPLNGYWTAEELPYLESYLERHIYNYLKENNFQLAENNLAADKIIRKIMSENAEQFLVKHFKS